MIGKWVPVAVLAASTVLSGCVEEERVAYVRPAPSPEAVEVVAVAPGPDNVYVRGHWEWDGSRYVWVISRSIRRPSPHAVWIPAHWQNSPHGWYWQAGRWAGGRKEKPSVVATPAPVIIEESSPAAPANPAAPAASVPPAPTYLPPPPPANPPPPPAAAPAS
jgi:hypothetical protein